MALALRDARVLSDEMLADRDWAAAGDRYAARLHHDQKRGDCAPCGAVLRSRRHPNEYRIAAVRAYAAIGSVKA